MKTVTKKVYYCDFCKKHGLTSVSILEHEKHCTMNPDRNCRMCDLRPDQEFIKPEIKEKKISDWYTGKEIEVKGDLCPACLLSFIRQNKITDIVIDPKSNDGFSNWNYEKASKKWIDMHNEDYRDGCY